MVLRIDVFSQKGGVGKTSLGILLARQMSPRSVLVIDADLTGSCLGESLYSKASSSWDAAEGLATLIAGRPETLSDQLNPLPIYRYEPGGKANAKTKDYLAKKKTVKDQLLFCPSHLYADAGQHADVLRALVAHESAGGWIRYVINELINRAKDYFKDLACVIVDHSPGMAQLQSECLAEIIRAKPTAQRRGLIVSSPDVVDIAMTSMFLVDAAKEARKHSGSLDGLKVVMNRVPAKPPVDKSARDLGSRIDVPEDQSIRDANMKGELADRNVASAVSDAIGEIIDWVQA